MARHKPIAEGGYQRGEQNRMRIVDSALRLVGERGFAGASTRDIASDDVYLNLIGAIIVFIHDSPFGRDWRLFMARERVGLSPPGALDLMKKRLYRRIRSVTAAVVGRLTMRPADNERTLIRTFAINNQGMVLRVLPRQGLSMLGWDNIDSHRMKEVIEVLLG